MDLCAAQRRKKVGEEGGDYWCCTLLENRSRLRVGRGVDASEGAAAQQLWRYWRETWGRPQPPPLVSDGSGGHHDALLEVFGIPHGQRRVAGEGWHSLQVVKIHNDYRQVIGLRPHLIWGQALQTQSPLAPHLAYVERTHLTSRLMNARLVRQTLRFSKRVALLRASCDWGDALYNLVRPLRSLRQPSRQPARRWIPASPAMAAGLTDHLWTVSELLHVIPLFTNSP
jgi:hypothetical protein